MILVIVVTYNGMRWIDRCLSSIVESERPKGQEIRGYVIDNGSTDGTQGYVQEHFPEMIFIQNEGNTGFGQANNIGMQYALDGGYDYVYLLNQDAWLEDDTICRLVDVYKKNSGYGILSPMQMQADGITCDRQFSKRMKTAGKAGRSGVCEVPYIMAAHWLIPRVCLLKTGLFSPVFPHWGEDENYCDRARYHGFKVGVVNGAKAVHDRAERLEEAGVKIRRNYHMHTVARLSSLLHPQRFPAIAVIGYALYNCLKYRSLLPMRYMLDIFSSYSRIRACRKESMKDGAFLEVKS